MGNFVKNAGQIHSLAESLAAGEQSSRQICEALIARHKEVESEINAFRYLNEESILEAADAADKRRAAGEALSDYDGIPIAIKDNIAISGEPNGSASKLLEKFTSTYDATVIEKLKGRGFVPFGRTNMDEFAMGSSTENSAYGVSTNPWNTEYVSGGSSGGSAAAVASGQAIAALGSDTGGSIRQPAGFCGIVGLKPTYGRVSRYGLTAFASSLDQIGPMCQDVKDAAILLESIAGSDARDNTSLPESCDGLLDALENADVKGLKIGLPKEFFEIDGLDDELRQATEKAKDLLKEGGAEIVELSLPNLDHGVAVYYVIATAEASSNLARFDGIRYGNRKTGENLLDIYLNTREEGFGDEVKRRIILGTYVLTGYSEAVYLRAQKVRTLIRQDLQKAFNSCDLILSPVTPSPSFKVGAISDPLHMYLADIFTIPYNLAGNCAISLPAGTNAAGLPLNVQLAAPHLAEKQLLQASHWLEGQL